MTNNLFPTVGGLSFPVVCRNYGSQDKGVSQPVTNGMVQLSPNDRWRLPSYSQCHRIRY